MEDKNKLKNMYILFFQIINVVNVKNLVSVGCTVLFLCSQRARKELLPC